MASETVTESPAEPKPAPENSASGEALSSAEAEADAPVGGAASGVAGCNDGASWMGCTFPAGKDEVSLTDMWIPGSHDSATYAISDNSEYAHNCNSMPAALPASVASKWARTQSANLREQAAGGARYFDVRPFFTREDDLKTCHSLVGASMDQALSKFGGEGLASFAAAHPDEAFIIDFNGVFADNNQATSAAHVEKLQAWVEKRLGTQIFRPGTGGKARLGDVTLADLRAAGRNIIVTGPTEFSGKTIWDRTTNIYSCWEDNSRAAYGYWNLQAYTGIREDYLNREVLCLNNRRSDNSLNVLNYILDSGCPLGDAICGPLFVAKAGIVEDTSKILDKRVDIVGRRVKAVAPAVIMRDVAQSASNSEIWSLNSGSNS